MDPNWASFSDDKNPPAIPLLAVAHLVSWLRWSRLVIDWHNYGYTILRMTKKGHYSVTLYHWFEKIFGRGAFGYFCVSEAMKADLEKNWDVKYCCLFGTRSDFTELVYYMTDLRKYTRKQPWKNLMRSSPLMTSERHLQKRSRGQS